MLRSELIHPQISQILARAGHSSKVLIADGNYPASSAIGPKAELISLNLGHSRSGSACAPDRNPRGSRQHDGHA